MRPLFIISFIIIFFHLTFFLLRNNSLQISVPAVKGEADLRSWNFEKNGNVALQGEWEFYWNELIENSNERKSFFANFPKDKKHFIQVPSEWQNYELDGKKLPAFGYAMYRLRIFLPELHPELGLYMTDAATAYNVYVNGKLKLAMGKISRTKEGAEPMLRYKSFKIPKLENTELEIVILVSNFHNLKAGFWNKPLIGSYENIRQQSLNITYMNFITVGSLMIMGLYHIFLFWIRPSDKSPLYFGIFCLIMMLRPVFLEERLIMDIIPVSFETAFKTEHFTAFLGLALFMLFIRSLFPEDISRWAVYGVASAGFGSTLFTLALPMPHYSFRLVFWMEILLLVSIVYTFSVFIRAFIRKRPDAAPMLFGTSVFYLMTANDILYGMGVIRTLHLSHYGFLFFTFVQSAMLSMKFSRAFGISEKLASELLDKTESLQKINAELTVFKSELETKVSERTAELEKSYNDHFMEMQKVAGLEKELAVRKERESIFSDIHDNLGAKLLYLSVMMNSLKPGKVITADIQRIVRDTIDEVMKSLRSRLLILEDTSFAEKNFIEGFRFFLLRRYGIAGRKFRLSVPDSFEQTFLSGEQYHNFFSIIQEIISNDLKYGKNITNWEIKQTEKHIRIFISSESCYVKKEINRGYGNKHIRKRTKLAGGKYYERLKNGLFYAEIRIAKKP